MIKKLFEIIDSSYKDYIKVWEDVCNIESPTSSKEGVDAVGRYFAEFGKKRGWSVEVFHQELVGDVVTLIMNPDAKGKPIALSGHIDTVHPIGLFGNPPVKIEGDKIYGPGVSDCKGGTVIALLTMDALMKAGYKERPVMLLLQSDEEGGSRLSKKATIRHICERSADADAFFNLEGYTPGRACITRKGIITFAFKVFGQEAHSSKCATEGANAICEAAHKIIELEKLKDAAGLTCNCGVISGGSVPNTVAGYCEFMANVRFATAEQLEWVKAYAKEIADRVYVEGCRTEVEQFGFRVAMELEERNQKLLEKINRILGEVGLQTLEPSGGTGGSDAADVTVFGAVPCIDCLGSEGGYIHSPKEFALIDSLPLGAKRLAAIIANF